MYPQKIHVWNFGPIREADIKLAPLTVIMGQNNTGKTFLSSLMTLSDILSVGISIRLREESEEKSVGDEFIRKLQRITINELKKTYTIANVRELVGRIDDETRISFIFGIDEIKDLRIDIRFNKDDDLEISGNFEILFEDKRIKESELMFPDVIYVPAERSGIMRTYRQLMRLYLEYFWPTIFPEAFKERIEKFLGRKFRIPGLVGRFLSQLFAIKQFTREEYNRSDFKDVLTSLERVLDGFIELTPEFEVLYHSRHLPQPLSLANTSSMVSELAGLYLMISLLERGDWLVIEEPESHIHPQGQMDVARALVALIRCGSNCLITTHSDLLALKLAQMVGLEHLSANERRALGYGGNEFLRRDEFSLYFMEKFDDGTSKSRKIEISEAGEIEELPSYSTVVEQLYGESVELLKLHEKIRSLP